MGLRLFIILSLLITAPAQAAVPKCLTNLTKIASDTITMGLAEAKKHLPWTPDPRRITADEYERIRSSKVSQYFPKGKINAEQKAKFLADYKKLSDNFDIMHLQKGRLRQGKEVAEQMDQMADVLLRNGFAKQNKDKTVEQLYLDENFMRGKPADLKPVTMGRALASAAMYPVYLSGWALKEAGVFIWDNARWAARLAIGGTVVGAGLALVLDPVKYAIDRNVNEYAGWIGVDTSLYVNSAERLLKGGMQSASDQVLGAKTEMEKANNSLSEVNRKYALKEISHEDAVKMWDQIDRTFLEHKRVMSSMINDNVASGRVYFRDANITYPLLFVNSAINANNEMMNHRQIVLLLEIKSQDHKLTEAELKELEYHKAEMPKSKQRLSSALVAWKVHEYIYPEFNRAHFMKTHPDSIPLMDAYQSFEKNFRMQDYANEFEMEMKRQLNELGINIQPGGFNHPTQKRSSM